MTSQEKMIWARLRKKQLGVKFRRQHAIGLYIVDFYCSEKNLIVEIDDGQHFENKEYDNKPTKYLENLGFRVLRFWNNEVNDTREGVILRIMQEVEK